MCTNANGDCIVIVNGYYVEAAVCMAVGFVWYFAYKSVVKNLQNRSPSNWLVDLSGPNERETTTMMAAASPMLAGR